MQFLYFCSSLRANHLMIFCFVCVRQFLFLNEILQCSLTSMNITNSFLSTLSSIKRFRIILQFSFIIFYTVFLLQFFFFNFFIFFFFVNVIFSFFFWKNYIEHEHEKLWINEFWRSKSFMSTKFLIFASSLVVFHFFFVVVGSWFWEWPQKCFMYFCTLCFVSMIWEFCTIFSSSCKFFLYFSWNLK